MEVSYALRKFFNDDMLEELGVDEIKDKVNHKYVRLLKHTFSVILRLFKQLFCSFSKVPIEKDGKTNVADYSNLKSYKSYQPNGLLCREPDSFRPELELPVEDFKMLK